MIAITERDADKVCSIIRPKLQGIKDNYEETYRKMKFLKDTELNGDYSEEYKLEITNSFQNAVHELNNDYEQLKREYSFIIDLMLSGSDMSGVAL